MKAIIEFDLGVDSDDLDSWDTFSKMGSTRDNVENAKEFIRSKLKYEDTSKETRKVLEAIREILCHE